MVWQIVNVYVTGSCEDVPQEWTHSKHTDEKRIAKPFEMEWPNGCTDEEDFCTDEENFCKDEVKWMNCWRKCLNRWTNEPLNKIIIVELMQVISQTTEENYNTIILEQAPLQLYKNEQINHFLFWKLIDFRKSDTVLKFIVSRIKQLCRRLR